MALTTEERKQITEEFRTHDKDSGSSALQIALLTHDIRALTEHMKKHQKDFHSRRGLMQKVGIRNRLLRYLQRKNASAHKDLVQKLGLRP